MRRVLVAPTLAVALATLPAAAATVPPKQAVARAQQEWLLELRKSAREGDRARDFPSPPRAVLVRRLRRAQQLYRFRIVSVRMLHPLQAAPVVVVRSARKLEIAHATPKIVEIFNPHRRTRRNPSGYAYEGYFFVAQDTRGVPYLATFNFMRAPRVGGGQWAAEERLYPYPHG